MAVGTGLRQPLKNSLICRPEGGRKKRPPSVLQGLAAAVAAATVVVAAVVAASAAAQDQKNNDNPRASAKVVVAHIELPPFGLHYSVWRRGNSCYSVLADFLQPNFSSADNFGKLPQIVDLIGDGRSFWLGQCMRVKPAGIQTGIFRALHVGGQGVAHQQDL